MNKPLSIVCRAATREDIPAVLRLYAQPDLDDGKELSLSEAERLFKRISEYPDYKIHVAFSGTQLVGTFALLIMDNLAHMGAPSAIIEDVAVDPEWQGRGSGKTNDGICLAIMWQEGVLQDDTLLQPEAHQSTCVLRIAGFRAAWL